MIRSGGSSRIRRVVSASRSAVRRRRQPLSASKPPPECFRGFLTDAGTEPRHAPFRRTLDVNRLKPPGAVARPAVVERALLGTVPDGDNTHIVAGGGQSVGLSNRARIVQQLVRRDGTDAHVSAASTARPPSARAYETAPPHRAARARRHRSSDRPRRSWRRAPARAGRSADPLRDRSAIARTRLASSSGCPGFTVHSANSPVRDLRDSADPAGDHRGLARHRLDDDAAERLGPEARHDRHVARAEQTGDVALMLDPRDCPVNPQTFRQAAQLAKIVTDAAAGRRASSPRGRPARDGLAACVRSG